MRECTHLEQVVEHGARALPHEHEETSEVDGDADRGERHDDIPAKVIKEFKCGAETLG